jgi:5-carboxymethyl-2-hydroxymuconate isomerase
MPEITVELTANLEEVRRTIQELFREGADHD